MRKRQRDATVVNSDAFFLVQLSVRAMLDWIGEELKRIST